MVEGLIECPVYEAAAGDRIRIVIEYAELWRPVFWFKLGSDGSLYVGPRYTKVTTLRHGTATHVQGSEYRITYNDGTSISNIDSLKKAKISFHASGVINTPAGRMLRSPLRSLGEQQLLCGMVFQHLNGFAGIELGDIKKRDVCLRYPIDESRPLWGYIYAAARTSVHIVKRASAAHQMNLLFAYSGLDGTADLVLQVVLGHGAQGPWPPNSYLIFAASDSAG